MRCLHKAVGVVGLAGPAGFGFAQDPAHGRDVTQQSVAVQWVGQFGGSGESIPPPWQVVRLNAHVPPTRYAVRQWQGVQAVEAQAHASMALLARPISIDLDQTPVLCWRWRVDAPVAAADMTKKAGDDFAARVYVAFDLPAEAMSLSTRARIRLGRMLWGQFVPDAAVNYVWDNSHPIGTARRSAYTDRTQMVVLRTGSVDAGHWVTERRDVVADAERAFGNVRLSASLLAVASDTDNTAGDAHAGFADLHFVPSKTPCAFPARDAP